MNDYKTVAEIASDEIVEKKSRFIADVSPCKTEEEALSFLQTVKKKYPDASHHVYAYVCRDNNSRRYSDDNEPQGTAGIPTLDVILKEGLTDTCVVTTRYFGGTLLGASGLVRAYSKAAKKGIDAARPVNMIFSDIFTVKTNYQDLGKIQYDIKKNGFSILSTEFTENVSISVCTECSRNEELVKKLTECSMGRAKIEKTDTCFVPREVCINE